MAISKKRAPKTGISNIDRVISTIYDDINELISAVNVGETSQQKATTKGKSGDLRIVKDGTGDYYIEAKTDEGWIQSTNTTASGFKFKERN